MRSKLMPVAAASALLVSSACGCAMETGSDETSADPATGSVGERTGTTEEAQDVPIYGYPSGRFGRTDFARFVVGIPYIPFGSGFYDGPTYGTPEWYGYGTTPPSKSSGAGAHPQR
jgi:hypothetical protein